MGNVHLDIIQIFMCLLWLASVSGSAPDCWRKAYHVSLKQKSEYFCLCTSFTEINMPTNSLKKLQNVMSLEQREEEIGFG